MLHLCSLRPVETDSGYVETVRRGGVPQEIFLRHQNLHTNKNYKSYSTANLLGLTQTNTLDQALGLAAEGFSGFRVCSSTEALCPMRPSPPNLVHVPFSLVLLLFLPLRLLGPKLLGRILELLKGSLGQLRGA